MIPKKHKILQEYFPKVLKGKRFFGDFGDFIVSSSLSDKVHGGIVIAKKHAKKAVIRNKVKRQYYSLFAEYLPYFPKKTLVYMVKNQILPDSEQDFKDEFKKLSEQIISFYEKNN